MTIIEFLQELESFFPLNEADETVKKRIAFYNEILEAETAKTGKSYNYRQIIKWFLKNYKYKSFPALSNILEALPHGEVQSYKECSNEGCIIRLILDDNYCYDFTIVNFDTNTTLNEIKKRFEYKDDLGIIQTKIKKILRYPKGTILIGNQMFMP